MAAVFLVSGGADSIYMLKKRGSYFTGPSRVLYIDHHTRPAEEHAKDLECILKAMGPDEQLEVRDYHHKKGNFEKEASKFRYEAARQLALEMNTGTPRIFTGHHLDDLTESLMHSIINSGEVAGVSPSFYKECSLHKPNSNLTKEQIKKYLIENNIEWNEDSTNTDFRYDRNWIRKFFSKWGARGRDNFYSFIKKYQMYKNFAEDQAQSLYQRGSITFQEYEELNLVLKDCLIKKVAGSKYKKSYIYEFEKTLGKQIHRSGGKVQLSFGFTFENQRISWNCR